MVHRQPEETASACGGVTSYELVVAVLRVRVIVTRSNNNSTCDNMDGKLVLPIGNSYYLFATWFIYATVPLFRL